MTLRPPHQSQGAQSATGEGLVGDPASTQDPDPDVPGAGEEDGGTEPVPTAPERVRTGVPRVDDVIRSVEELEERPIEEHVGVFESAQVQLRRALDEPGDDRGDALDDRPEPA